MNVHRVRRGNQCALIVPRPPVSHLTPAITLGYITARSAAASNCGACAAEATLAGVSAKQTIAAI